MPRPPVFAFALALLLVVGWAVTGSASSAAAPGDETSRQPGVETVLPVVGELLHDFDPPSRPWEAGRRGVVLSAADGALVVAARSGVVRFSGEVAEAGWVSIDHGVGLDTTYGVLDPRFVTVGDVVEAGDPIGLRAPGTDGLHWGARLDGDYIHPLSLLAPWRVRLVPTDDAPVSPLGSPGTRRPIPG